MQLEKNTVLWAAAHGDLEMLMLAHGKRYSWDGWVMMFAAGNGDLNMLQWAHENQCPLDDDEGLDHYYMLAQFYEERLCADDVMFNHLSNLVYAYKHQCSFRQMMCVAAACSGNLAVLQYLRQIGVPWNEWTCALAASKGHFEILKWARQNGCPWNEFTCEYAHDANHLLILQWCLQQGCRITDKWKYSVYFTPNHYQTLKWLYKHHGFYSRGFKNTKPFIEQWFDCIDNELDVAIMVPDLNELIKAFI